MELLNSPANHLHALFQDLIEPSRKVARKVRQDSMEKEAGAGGDYSQLPAVDAETVGKWVYFASRILPPIFVATILLSISTKFRSLIFPSI